VQLYFLLVRILNWEACFDSVSDPGLNWFVGNVACLKSDFRAVDLFKPRDKVSQHVHAVMAVTQVA
jgi:hypothetical protein